MFESKQINRNENSKHLMNYRQYLTTDMRCVDRMGDECGVIKNLSRTTNESLWNITKIEAWLNLEFLLRHQ